MGLVHWWPGPVFCWLLAGFRVLSGHSGDESLSLMVPLSSCVTQGLGLVWSKDLFEFKGAAWDGKGCV